MVRCIETTGVCDAIALRNAQASPLLRLPAETRNTIYAYVLTESPDAKYMFTRYLTWTNSGEERVGGLVDASERPHRLALLATCRQLHAETQALPFVLNTSWFTDFAFVQARIMGLLPYQRDTITNIEITDYIGRTVHGDIRRLRRLGYNELLSMLPNVRNVAIFRSYFPELAREVDKQRKAISAMVAWLKGSSGQVEVKLDGKVM